MFMHNKRLQYTVRVSETDPALANLMLEQFGGPQGELAAAMRYFTQALAEDDPGRKDMLLDIATEELSHLEVIGTIERQGGNPFGGNPDNLISIPIALFLELYGTGRSLNITVMARSHGDMARLQDLAIGAFRVIRGLSVDADNDFDMFSNDSARESFNELANTVTGAASMFRRDLLDDALPLPSAPGPVYHDHWLALVALARGEIRYIDAPLYDYVQHERAFLGHSAANALEPTAQLCLACLTAVLRQSG